MRLNRLLAMHCFCYTYDAKVDKFCIFDHVDLYL